MARGHKTGGGSRKGTPNKLTSELKDMIEGALSDVGGRQYLVEQARENPVAFMTLVGKIIPRDLNVSGQIKHTLESLILAGLQKPEALR